MSDADDLWLEDRQGVRALAWVAERNAESLAVLEKDRRFDPFYRTIRDFLVAEDRIPAPSLLGGVIYNFWQDSVHVRGLWRRTTPESFARPEPAWETVLDLDELARVEKENWVWKGADCLAPEHVRCLISLSRGGGDAVVIREFDLGTRRFVKDGFNLPEAKSSMTWRDRDSVFVGTDFGPGSMTDSGYPRLVKRWRRGTPLASAPTLYEGQRTDVGADGFAEIRPNEAPRYLIRSLPSFFEETNFLIDERKGLLKVPFPNDASFLGTFLGNFVAKLRSEWKIGRKLWPAGSVVSLPITAAGREARAREIEILYTPDDRSTAENVTFSRDAIYIDVLRDVQSELHRIRRGAGGHAWPSRRLELPAAGSLGVAAINAFDTRVYVSAQGFLEPPRLLLFDGVELEPVVSAVRALPPRFDATGMKVEQFAAQSPDGTRIPYFVVRKNGDSGPRPTLLYGYGGFEASLTPGYQGSLGKLWLEAGGIYALANIRGGGEFGPRWHEAALRGNRQRSFDDFAAVAADLETRGLTSPRRLGIEGGSNGGLLVGATVVQHPELIAAAVCQVPLLDMLRYTKLPAGASWIGEYGDPDNPKDAEFLAQYSPYHNARAGRGYPEVFFNTSTLDDRVHPGHARKMVEIGRASCRERV